MAMSDKEQDRADIRGLFEADGGGRVCSFCGGIHTRACARVAEFELYESGKLQRVRFWPAGEWDDEHVIWPEMGFEEDEEEDGQS
jgi:hypothetical protein